MASLIIQLVWLLHLQLPFFISAQNVTLGESKSTLDNNPYWKSPSGEFAFGFQRVDGRGDLFLLAIWFDKIPERTIVWTANDGTPVEKGSTVELTLAGVLSLNDQILKRPLSSGGEVAGAAMLDTGNFVIFSDEFKFLWESFKEPTDTILPTQRLDRGVALIARHSKDDYKVGNFKFTLQPDRNLVLYALASGTTRSYAPYWASDTVDSGSQLIFNESGYIYLAQVDGNQTIITKGVPHSTRDYYQRATLSFNGVFRQYTYPKSSKSSQSWSSAWYIPDDICSVDFGDVESGICGFNSYCKMEDANPTCHCPPGYNYSDPKDTFGGCKQNFLPQSCNTDRLRVGDGYKMQKIPNVDWPYNNYRWYKNVAVEQCSDTCLNDCLCAVSISLDGDCWLKRFPLSNGKSNPKYAVKSLTALIKVGNTTLNSPPPPQPLKKKNSPPPGLGFGGDKKHKDKRFLLVLILLGTSVFLNLVFLLLIHPFKKQFKTMPRTSTFGMDLRSFTYKELEEATDGFNEEVGQGAFSIVYKGSLRNVTGSFVAVKRLDRVARAAEKEFKAEVNAIGMTNHKNLVKLLGYCEEGNNRLLVYEYMKNGSLADLLFGSSRPEWSLRIQVAFGIARGLAYLHGDISSQIIHCDVKPQNILLDDFFMAKISDFGLAKLLNADQTRTNTGIRGTRGYVAPEWFKNMAITAKVDVYSFGILLLEIIFCRKNAKVESGAEEIDILSEWVYECCELKDFHQLVLNDEEAKNDGKTLERFLIVALWCIQENPSQRPSMKKVIQMLEGAVEVSMPPKPSFLSSIG